MLCVRFHLRGLKSSRSNSIVTLSPMKTLLICREGAPLEQVVLARWLNSFSNLVGIIIVQEPESRTWRRIRREVKRIEVLRFLDVLAFRFYYRFFSPAKTSAGSDGSGKSCNRSALSMRTSLRTRRY
jgi:hypothetical protein